MNTAELKKLAEAATPGPWHWDSDPLKGDPFGRVRFRVVAVGRTITQCYYSSGDDMAQKEAAYIAAANPAAILELLAELRRLSSELEALKKAISDAQPVAWFYKTHAGDKQAFTSEPPPRLKELCQPLYTLKGIK